MEKKEDSYFSTDNLQFSRPIGRKGILPLFPDTRQLLNVQGVDVIDVDVVRFGALHDLDGAADDDVQGSAIGDDADVVIEHAAGVEQWDGEAQGILDQHLHLVDDRVAVRLDLLVQLVFAKSQHGHEVGAGADGEFDEAFPPLQHKPEQLRARVEGLARAADDNGDGAAHAFAVGAAA